jgi:uncharacterized protein HemX
LLVVLLLSVVVLLAAPVRAGAAPAVPVAPVAPAARAQDEPTTTSPTFGENPVAPEQHIIPRPNSGTEPEDAGDRGGALQFAVLGAIVVGVSVVATLAVRESRRNRRQQAATSA